MDTLFCLFVVGFLNGGVISNSNFFVKSAEKEFGLLSGEFETNSLFRFHGSITTTSRGMCRMQNNMDNTLADEKEYHSLSETVKPTKLFVNISAIKHNIRAIKHFVGSDVEVMPVVKGNAYGVGFDIVADALEGNPDVRICAVATAAEAVALRRHFCGAILVLYHPTYEDIPTIVENDFELSVTNLDFLRALDKRAVRRIRVHIIVEVGTGLLGVKIEELEGFCSAVKQLENIHVVALYMHYSSVDGCNTPADVEFTAAQTALFPSAIAIAEGVLGPIRHKHAASTAAVVLQPRSHYTLVRPGDPLFGIPPIAAVGQAIDLQPALRLVSTVVQVADVPAGSPIGYGRSFVTARASRIATVAAGMAEGLHTGMSNGVGSVVVNGRLAPIVGRVAMHLTLVDVTDIPEEVKFGDAVTIVDNDLITFNDLERQSGTDSIVEVLMQITNTVQRVVVE